MTKLFCFGLGYVAKHLTTQYLFEACQGTHQTKNSTPPPSLVFNQLQQPRPAVLDRYTHFLISIPPQNGTDLVLDYYIDYFKNRGPGVKWVGYLSATSVYGDHAGSWVDETTSPAPTTDRGRQRLNAEKAWLRLFEGAQCPVHIFRLSSIYGPYRSAFDRIGQPPPVLVDKAGHFFSRIHVADICQVLWQTINHPHPGQIYNLSDDLPAENAAVMEYAYSLLNQTPPARVPFAQAQLSEVMREYYNENKRVKNDKIKQELGISLLYPTYREGLKNCLSSIDDQSKKNLHR